jgi:urease accessory protein
MSARFTAHAAVTAECDGTGRTRITRLRSDGPLAVRAAGGHDPTTATVYLVGAAAGPLGGDDLTLHLIVAPGARLTVRSAATMLTMPGGPIGQGGQGDPGGSGESRFTIKALVGAGGRLDFGPEPTVAVAGCRHRSAADIELGSRAVLRWREELILGRHAEPPGRYASRCDVTLDGVPLVRHELRVDDEATYAGRAVLAGAGATGTVVLTGPDLIKEPDTAEGLAVLPLAGHGVLVCATAENASVLRRRLDRGAAIARGRPFNAGMAS